MKTQAQLLNEINEVSFALNDIVLYLDTHPSDKEALQYFHTCLRNRKQALEEYESSYEPLIIDCIKSEQNNTANPHWTWIEGPLPWEGVNE